MKNPHLRRFGVEIECGMPGGCEQTAELFGIHEYEENEEGWSVDNDGSGVELRTPILRGTAGFEKLRWAMDRLKQYGGYVTGADGLHIHHDAPEFLDNPALCLQIVNSWRNNIQAIHEMVHPRRRGSGACPEWSSYSYDLLLSWSKGESTYLRAHRNDLNLASLSDHGSIEIRLHEGTLDAEVAIAWVKFGQRFIHETLRASDPIEQSETDELLMSRIKLSDEAKAILAAKKTKDYITDGSHYQGRPHYA